MKQNRNQKEQQRQNFNPAESRRAGQQNKQASRNRQQQNRQAMEEEAE